MRPPHSGGGHGEYQCGARRKPSGASTAGEKPGVHRRLQPPPSCGRNHYSGPVWTTLVIGEVGVMAGGTKVGSEPRYTGMVYNSAPGGRHPLKIPVCRRGHCVIAALPRPRKRSLDATPWSCGRDHLCGPVWTTHVMAGRVMVVEGCSPRKAG